MLICFKDVWDIKINLVSGMSNSIITHLSLKIPPLKTIFNLKKVLIEFTNPNLSLEYKFLLYLGHSK